MRPLIEADRRAATVEPEPNHTKGWLMRPLLAIAILLTLTARAEALTLGLFTGYAPCANIFDPSCDLSNPQYLSGSFFLDETATFAITNSGGTRSGFLTSPSQTIAGQFGAYTFEESAAPLQFGGTTFQSSTVLHVADFPQVLNLETDFWIIRSTLTGPAVNGVSPTLLNLFNFTAPPDDSTDNVSIHPPRLGTVSYVIGFSDGSSASGRLSTLQVPDAGATWSLMLFAGAALVVLRRRHF